MTLASGSKLGAYEILAPLGAGGMGEVYRAKDARLGRDVAIKVLPSATATDPDRRARFEQEARSASALNHPNILTIYDVGEAEGTVFIAMELVEGRTLREILASGDPLPTRRLLDLAVQIAEGLAKAHAAGIVHRDLKPENVMVSKDGFVKILDFGLAKLTEPVSTDASVMPTAVAAPTQPGTVMGTAGYMSPEQASGHPVDFRSDQFSLGSILYEMATGEKAFQRKTGAETLVAIIREEPAPLSQAAPKAPAPVRWIVERCLAKDPEERYASTKDLARDLKSLRDHLTETSASGALEAAEPAKAKRRGWLLPAIAALTAGIGLGYLLHGLSGARTGARADIKRLTFARGSMRSARFAPDGQTIVYGAAWEGLPLEIFTTRADSSESRPLGLPKADVLAVSSTGELAVSLGRHFMFGFQTAGTLARVPLAGGAPRELLENVQDADWSPDGKELAITRVVGSRGQVEYPIGKVLFDAAGWVSDVRVSPDGRLVAFVDHPQKGDNNGNVKVVDTSGKLRMTGPYSQGGVAWSRRGDEVWSSDGANGVTATTLSGRSRSVWLNPGAGIFDIARDGRALVFHNASRREIVGLAKGERTERNLTWLNWSLPGGLSPDGTTLVFSEQNLVPQGAYLRKLDGSPAVKIGTGGAVGFSPDGRWALTVSDDGDQLNLLPTGPGEPKSLPTGGIYCQSAAWFPDGKRIVASCHEPGRGYRLYVFEVSGGKPRVITPEGVSFIFTMVSSDGRSLIARGPDRRIAVYPTEPGEPRPVPGLETDDEPLAWTPDGKGILVYRPSPPPLRVEVVDVSTGRRTLWKELRPPDPSGVEQVGPIVIAGDESAYVYSYRRSLDELYLATGLK
jgi:Tol biopolymer transport system component/predicted Ser/Thr protein kinase